MHKNSLRAYGQERRNLSFRAMAILGVLTKLGKATDRQICKELGFSDMNSVRPRATELIQAGLIVEVDNITDEATGKRVRVLALPSAQQSDMLFNIPEDPKPEPKNYYQMGL